MFKKIFWSLIVLGASVGAFFGVRNMQDIIDWWRLRDYEPSAVIEQLARGASLNDEGEKLFYVHDPQLLDKSEFVGKCNVGQEVIVLGCYVSHQGIYIFNITDERLAGGKEVTVAHEMLHAAFDRLSPSEQDRLEQLLVGVYNDLKDQGILDRIKTYEERDPSSVTDELHSIIGTDVRDLPTALEDHYRQYFTDRQKVVDLAEHYNGEFIEREQQVKQYDEQLASMQGEIVRLEADVTMQGEALSRERQILEGLRSDPASYNAAVDAYNKLVRAYNVDVNTLKGLVNDYNGVVALRNAITVEERELFDAIDTRVEQL